MQLHTGTSSELPALGRALRRTEGRNAGKVPLWVLFPIMIWATQKDTTENKEFA